jgi:hypothetical protein
MKEKLQNHYRKLAPRQFVAGAVIVLVILDILNGLYLKLSWVKNGLSKNTVLLIIQGMKLHATDFDQATMTEIGGLVDKSFDFFLFLILMNNLFFYLFYLRQKIWAQGYVLFYTLTGAIFSGFMIFDGYGMGIGWMMFNLLAIPLYMYLYMGVKVHKFEAIPVPEKKEL